MRASFIASEVSTGLRRNVTMTIAMILTTAISLGLFGGGLLVVRLADKSKDIFLERVELQIFLKQDVYDKDPNCKVAPCSTLRSELQAEPGVESVTYLSAADAYKDATTRTFANQPELASLVRPGVLPASFKVKVSNPKRFGEVLEKYKKAKGVDYILDQRELVKRIFSVLDGARNAAFLIAIIQAVAAILLIANMVQIAAYTRRTEVTIMRLVGASRWYTQLPFLLEAVVAAVIGAILAIAGLVVAKIFVLDRGLRELYGVNILARISYADVLYIAPWLLIVGAAFAAATAWVTLRLRVT